MTWRLWSGPILFAVVVMAAIAGLLGGCGSSAQTPQSKAKANKAVHSSVQIVTVNGRRRQYVCFTYTTVDRGGIWCDLVKVSSSP